MLMHLAQVTQPVSHQHPHKQFHCVFKDGIKVSALEPEISGRQKWFSEKLLLKNLHVHCSFLGGNAQTHSQFSLQFGSNSGFCAGTPKAAHKASDI